jgi:hypothetical protein
MAIQTITERILLIARSPVAWFFASLHAAWFLLAVANMSPPSPALGTFLESVQGATTTLFAGRPFHFHYESIVLQMLISADLPAAFVEVLLALLALPLLKMVRLSLYSASYVGAGLLFLGATCQWLMIGYAVETWMLSRQWGARSVRTLTRHLVIIIVFTLLFTAVFVPIVNQRSRSRGFHHGGASFITFCPDSAAKADDPRT